MDGRRVAARTECSASTLKSLFSREYTKQSTVARTIRQSGGKDRHSKVFTSKGPRDRRVRLSVSTAIRFYDVQDRLGFDQPSKAVEWLIKKAKSAIDELGHLPEINTQLFQMTEFDMKGLLKCNGIASGIGENLCPYRSNKFPYSYQNSSLESTNLTDTQNNSPFLQQIDNNNMGVGIPFPTCYLQCQNEMAEGQSILGSPFVSSELVKQVNAMCCRPVENNSRDITSLSLHEKSAPERSPNFKDTTNEISVDIMDDATTHMFHYCSSIPFANLGDCTRENSLSSTWSIDRSCPVTCTVNGCFRTKNSEDNSIFMSSLPFPLQSSQNIVVSQLSETRRQDEFLKFFLDQIPLRGMGVLENSAMHSPDDLAVAKGSSISGTVLDEKIKQNIPSHDTSIDGIVHFQPSDITSFPEVRSGLCPLICVSRLHRR